MYCDSSLNKQIQVGISLSPLYYEELILCWVKNGLGQKWSGQKWSGQKWVGSKMGRVKNGQVKNGQVKNELGQKWYIIHSTGCEFKPQQRQKF